MVKVKKPVFVAIGVGQGDAFFLKKGSMTALIDGGSSLQGFPPQFQRISNREGVDILVCTHNDADHARGVLGFLRSGLMSKEVWLPGSWTDRLEDILLHPERFAEELISNIEKIDVRNERRPLLQTLGDQYSEEIMQQETNNEHVASKDALSEALEMATEIEAYSDIFWSYHLLWPPENWPNPWYRWWKMLRKDSGKFQLFLEAVSAMSYIREISLAAYHAGALIRWFEFNTTSNSGGISDFLVPLNAHEIFQIRRPRWHALMYLALTRSNKQSLVFISPTNDEEPAVLFTADSNLLFPQPIPWTDGMVVTAPHHGSEANAYAYRRFINETGNNLNVVWIRSDGRFKTRPGSSYLSAHGSHFCTLCRGSSHPKQDVCLTVASRKWTPIFTRSCCCV